MGGRREETATRRHDLTWRTDRNRLRRRIGRRSCRGPRTGWSRWQTYQAKVSRLERVNGHLQPEEEILLSIRREPKAVRLEWSSGPSKGREVIYSSALDPRMIFVHMPSTADSAAGHEDPR